MQAHWLTPERLIKSFMYTCMQTLSHRPWETIVLEERIKSISHLSSFLAHPNFGVDEETGFGGLAL